MICIEWTPLFSSPTQRIFQSEEEADPTQRIFQSEEEADPTQRIFQSEEEAESFFKRLLKTEEYRPIKMYSLELLREIVD